MRLGPWVLAIAMAHASACGDDASSDDSNDANDDASDDTSGADDDDDDASETGEDAGDTDGRMSARDTRYCEVLLVRMVDGALQAEVWNTAGLGTCPQDEWDALDADAIQQESDALAVLLNGPRSFLMDALSGDVGDDPQVTTFGTLQMVLVATLELDPADVAAGDTPYQTRTVNRDTEFQFWAGSEIYELTGPDGARYVMQSYSKIVDPDLEEADLAGLGDRLEPPEGWAFSVRTLEEDLVVTTPDAQATVVQDELTNTYQRFE